MQQLVPEPTVISTNPEELFDSGVSHLKKHRSKKALDAFRQAMSSKPNEPRYMSYFGLCLATADNRPEEAVPLCERAANPVRPRGLELAARWAMTVTALFAGRRMVRRCASGNDRQRDVVAVLLGRGIPHRGFHGLYQVFRIPIRNRADVETDRILANAHDHGNLGVSKRCRHLVR